MPAATIEDALREAHAVARTDRVTYWTLEFHHDSFTTPARVVWGWDDIDATLEADAPVDGGQSVSFVAVPFEFALPNVETDRLPAMNLTIFDPEYSLAQPLEDASADPKPLRCIVRSFLSNDLAGGPQQTPLSLYIKRVTTSTRLPQVNAKASVPDWLNRRFVGPRITTTDFPGLLP